MTEPRHAILVDDDPYDRQLVARELRKSMPGMRLTEVINELQLRECFTAGDFDLVITDFHLGWTNGIEVLRTVKTQHPNCPVIMYTGTGSEEIAVQAMKLGLDDYIIKNVKHLVRLRVAVESAIEHAETKAMAERLSTELDNANSRSRLLFDKSKDGICVMSLELGVVEANASFARMIGVDETDQAIGMQPWQWDDIYSTPEKIRAKWPVPIVEPETFETRFRRPDGSVIEVEISATPTRQLGEPLLFFSCRDITQRKSAAAALEQSERHLEAAQTQAEIGSWECDWNGQTDIWSMEMYRLFNRASDAGIPTHDEFLESVHPDDRPLITGGLSAETPCNRASVFQRQFISLQREQGFANPTLRYRYRSIGYEGSTRHLEETIRAADVAGNGRVKRWLGTTMDVSDKVRAETALRESKERFLRALNHIPDIVAIYDTELRIRFINQTAATLTGRPTSDFLDKRDLEIWPETVCHPYLPVLQEALTKHIATTAEVKVDLPNVGNRHLRINCIPLLESENKVREIVSVISDLTEQTQLQAQLIHAQKMESVGRLAGGIAHDFNNVLTVVLNSVALARLRSPSDDLRCDLEMIEEAGRRGAALTRQLLTFSRQDSANPAVLDLNQVIEKICPMLGRLLGDRVHFMVQVNANPSHIIADAGQMEQVLVNLAVNASDAMPDGGELKIQTWFESSDSDGPIVRLSVSDTGIGIDSVTRQRIFEPYVTTKPVGKGTGLGLSTVYGIVKRSQGEISLDSQPGHGTTFHLRFPLATGHEPQADLPQGTGQPHCSELILVVEDDSTLRHIARDILASSGFDVVAVSDGSEAIEFIENTDKSVQLVFTDTVMPKTTGWQLREYLMQHHPDVQILGTSGYLDETLREPSQRFDWDHYIPKPYSMSQLATKIRSVLDERRN